MTFEELTQWLQEKNIELNQSVEPDDNSLAHYFPTAGGILKTMTETALGYTYMAIDGVESCIAAQKEMEHGNIHRCFIDMSACTGSCIGCPVMEKYRRNPVKDYIAVSSFAGTKDFLVEQPEIMQMKTAFFALEQNADQPSEAEIASILRQMGKFKPSQELNCGSCGYNICREKAAAIWQGKAEISMCLPFLKEKAENFSDTIVHNSPNALIVLNDKLEVQQLNAAALRLMNLRYASDILGDLVIRILDPGVFLRVRQSGRGVYNERVYLTEYNRWVEQTVVSTEDGRMLLCIMRDVTDEETERRKKETISRQTFEVADHVVEKQMRIVQEIASLLGETTAETKIALSKLKESIADE